MCGIAGYVGAQKLYPNKLKINSCTKLMKLRGPDYQGFKEFYLGKFKTLFCASRLSIIDITKSGSQPMFSADKRYVITFNGEIYNFLEVKEEMGNLYNFQTLKEQVCHNLS